MLKMTSSPVGLPKYFNPWEENKTETTSLHRLQ